MLYVTLQLQWQYSCIFSWDKSLFKGSSDCLIWFAMKLRLWHLAHMTWRNSITVILAELVLGDKQRQILKCRAHFFIYISSSPVSRSPTASSTFYICHRTMQLKQIQGREKQLILQFLLVNNACLPSLSPSGPAWCHVVVVRVIYLVSWRGTQDSFSLLLQALQGTVS